MPYILLIIITCYGSGAFASIGRDIVVLEGFAVGEELRLQYVAMGHPNNLEINQRAIERLSAIATADIDSRLSSQIDQMIAFLRLFSGQYRECIDALQRCKWSHIDFHNKVAPMEAHGDLLPIQESDNILQIENAAYLSMQRAIDTGCSYCAEVYTLLKKRQSDLLAPGLYKTQTTFDTAFGTLIIGKNHDAIGLLETIEAEHKFPVAGYIWDAFKVRVTNFMIHEYNQRLNFAMAHAIYKATRGLPIRDIFFDTVIRPHLNESLLEHVMHLERVNAKLSPPRPLTMSEERFGLLLLGRYTPRYDQLSRSDIYIEQLFNLMANKEMVSTNTVKDLSLHYVSIMVMILGRHTSAAETINLLQARELFIEPESVNENDGSLATAMFRKDYPYVIAGLNPRTEEIDDSLTQILLSCPDILAILRS